MKEDTLILDCNDLLLDLRDLGFDPYVYKSYQDDVIYINIDAPNESYYFKTEDLEDCLSRVEHHLSYEGYSEQKYFDKIYKYWKGNGIDVFYDPNGKNWRERLNSGKIQTNFRVTFEKKRKKLHKFESFKIN